MVGGGPGGFGPAPSRVLVRAPGSFRYLGTPLLLILIAALVAAARRALRSGGAGGLVGESTVGAGDVVGWALVAFFLPALCVTLLFIWTYRELLTPTEASRRFLWSHRRVRPAEATRIRFVAPHETPVHGAAARLDVYGRSDEPLLSYADIDPEWPAVVAALHAWVQARPELIRDHDTAALFAQLEVD
ncbi:MAG: hypothetical protein R2731_05330 [Nocardioides sp.]